MKPKTKKPACAGFFVATILVMLSELASRQLASRQRLEQQVRQRQVQQLQRRKQQEPVPVLELVQQQELVQELVQQEQQVFGHKQPKQ